MDRRRPLLRLWGVGAVGWIAYAGWLIGARTTFPDPNLLVTLAVTLVPPMVVLALGSAVAWIVRRMRV